MRAVANGVAFGMMALSGVRSAELSYYRRNRARVKARRKKKSALKGDS